MQRSGRLRKRCDGNADRSSPRKIMQQRENLMSSKESNVGTPHALPPNAFRASVGAVIAHDSGEVLALERAGMPGAWQMLQGGMNENEEPVEAVMREISEETGIRRESLDLIDE